MQLAIDTDAQTLTVDGQPIPLFSPEAFRILAHEVVRIGWNEKYVYTFTWLGQPMLQLPDDAFRVAELIYRLKPDVIVETGVAHGGGTLFYASVLNAIEHGQIIGVERNLYPHNRRALEGFDSAVKRRVMVIDGDSTASATVRAVRNCIHADDTVLLILDSNHSKAHVRAELDAYSSLVQPGGYIIAMDGLMQHLTDVPRGSAKWDTDNPAAAVQDFLQDNPNWEKAAPEWLWNQSPLTPNHAPTHYHGGWLRRLR